MVELSSPTLEHAFRKAEKTPAVLKAAAMRKNSLRLKGGGLFDWVIFGFPWRIFFLLYFTMLVNKGSGYVLTIPFGRNSTSNQLTGGQVIVNAGKRADADCIVI